MNICFDILGNAKDSMIRSIQLLAWKDIASDQARLKHAIVGPAHSLELLLKERLRRESPALIWENIDKYPSLNARTVTTATAVARLKRICGVELSKQDDATIMGIRATRNAIEHYEWRSTESEARFIVANAVSVAVSFAANHLNVDLTASLREDDTWTQFLAEMPRFVEVHASRIEAELLQKGENPVSCDSCGEVVVPMRGGCCAFCGHWRVD